MTSSSNLGQGSVWIDKVMSMKKLKSSKISFKSNHFVTSAESSLRIE